MRLSVVIPLTLLVLTDFSEARGSGNKRGSSSGKGGKRGNKVKSNKKGSDKNASKVPELPPWAKYCATLEKWADKEGKEGMAKRCKCFNAKQAGEQVSSDCENAIAGKNDKGEVKPMSIFERLCSKAEKGSELAEKCKCRVILNQKGRHREKGKCKQKMDGRRRLVRACNLLKHKDEEKFNARDRALKQKCEKLSKAAKEKMMQFASERHEKIMKCKKLLKEKKENKDSLGREDLQYMRKNCPEKDIFE